MTSTFARQRAAWATPLALCAVLGAQAQPSAVVYPARGQSGVQIEKDRFECHEWAKAQSGFDPTQPSAAAPTATAPATTTAATVPTTSSTGSMARGALGGAAIGEIASNDAGRGAAVGVLGAALRDHAKQQQMALARQQQQTAQQTAQQQQMAQRNQQRSTYERGVGACLEARGYTVK